ncbi:DUF302 domain-containing protein [Roseovarius salis]|uniref:DUF302 domain-containing protein n=1 Tax=Roseovarius salis TaxID=3376063 RepID=UPI0037C70DE6
MKRWILAAFMGLTGPALAAGDIVKVAAERDVPATMDALERAVKAAGATVFARIDHGAGAASAGVELAPAQLLVFGNPRLGSPAMQDSALAGLYLPLRVLVHEDASGQVWLAYEDPAGMLAALDGIEGDAGYIERMRGALQRLTESAAGG